MTKKEIQIIEETVKEHKKAMDHYYEEGKKTGQWKDHEIASATYRAVRDLAETIGIEFKQ